MPEPESLSRACATFRFCRVVVFINLILKEHCMKWIRNAWRVVVAMAALTIANPAWSDLEDSGNKGYYNGQDLLNAGLDLAEEEGKEALSKLGEDILASAVDSYAPGLSSVLGIGSSGEDPFKKYYEGILNEIR